MKSIRDLPPVQLTTGLDDEDDSVVIQLDKPVCWFTLSVEQAEQLALRLLYLSRQSQARRAGRN